MASNLTTDNIKTLSQLETIDATNESKAFFLCGNGEKMQKIAFNRLRKKINGTILPTKKPDNTEIGELWLQAEKKSDLIKNFHTHKFSDKIGFVLIDKIFYYINDKKAYCFDFEKNNDIYIEQKRLFEDVETFDFLVATKDLIVFFCKTDVTKSRAIDRATGESVLLNENYGGSLPFEVLDVANVTYPMEVASGFLIDNTDLSKFQFYTFEKLIDGSFSYVLKNQLDYSDLGTVNGAKIVLLSLVENGAYSENNSQIEIIPCVDGVYYIESIAICEHDIKQCFFRAFSDSETQKFKTIYLCIGENQASCLNPENQQIENFALYTDETTLPSVLCGVEILNGFYLLQKTTTPYNYALVRYMVNDNFDITVEKVRNVYDEMATDFDNYSSPRNLIIDIADEKRHLDGACVDPLMLLHHYLYNTGASGDRLSLLWSEYDYKMMLSYGDLVQEVQGYKGEQGVSIASVESETTQESGGENKIKITLSNGVEENFTIKNGIDGEVLQSQLDEVIEDLETLENSMSQRIADSIAEVVADAPEDFDTLKEMSNWIAEHKDDASAMNTAILENKTAIEELSKNYLKAIFPIGAVVITTNENNPSSIYGGVWEQIAQGRTLIGVGTGTDANGESVNFAENETGGEYKHTLATSEIPSHTHTMTHGHSASGSNSSNVYTYKGSGKPSLNENTTTDYGASYGKTSVTVSVNNYSGNTGATGSGNAHNNMQPYLAVYFWKRTA